MESSTLEQAKQAIPAEVRMFSGCRDEQTSADVSNVATFQLPDPAGRAGGACTSAMLKVLYADHKKIEEDLTFEQVLLKMRDILQEGRYTQIPQLTSSRPMDVQATFDLVPPSCEGGTRRALLIGINYIGHSQGVLSGCHNDVKNMLEYIKDVHGFEDANCTVLLDDGVHKAPTKENILEAYRTIVAQTKSGDAVFAHYSGHGAKLRDDDGDEKDGYDETLVPVDYNSAGMIRDDELFQTLVAPLPEGSVLTSVMDCCHSGTVLDLPYVFLADGEHEQMEAVPDFDFATLNKFFQMYMAAQQAGGGASDPVAMLLKGCGAAGCNIM